MRNLLVSLSIILLLFFLQVAIYDLLLKPPTSAWGATPEETVANMPGDNLSEEYQSTRAITINASLQDTWAWLNQFGADRSGFFSYTFIERFLGYETNAQAIVAARFPDLKPGDIIRGSITPSKSLIVYEFPVLQTQPERYLIIQNWGTFLLEPIDDHKTRLIIRTHRPITDNLAETLFEYYFAEGLHFVMERATLTGFKKRVETGEGPVFDDTRDKLWFLGILASAFAIAILIFLLHGMQKLIIPAVLSTFWTITLLILAPVPLYSLSLFILIFVAILFSVFTSQTSTANKTGT